MPTDLITAKLNAYQDQTKVERENLHIITQESPYDRTRREIHDLLAKNETYRASILRGVTTFGEFLFVFSFVSAYWSNIPYGAAGLSADAITTAARSMDEVFYKFGDVIIQQDDIGDSFFVLEEGFVSVTVRTSHQLDFCGTCLFSVFSSLLNHD